MLFNSNIIIDRLGISDELLTKSKQRIQDVLDVVSECDTLNKIKTI